MRFISMGKNGFPLNAKSKVLGDDHLSMYIFVELHILLLNGMSQVFIVANWYIKKTPTMIIYRLYN